MLAKVIVWAQEWEDAINRGERALRDMGLQGIKTTIPYYQEILNVDDFRMGIFDTGFVDAHPELVKYPTSRPTRELTAAIAAALSAHHGL